MHAMHSSPESERLAHHRDERIRWQVGVKPSYFFKDAIWQAALSLALFRQAHAAKRDTGEIARKPHVGPRSEALLLSVLGMLSEG